ncbi:rhodanese-like domain-containing protein [Gottschalkiaceae bacterium SANA]|nr:rhodanese-like domain-containing protein [Gottschalkiaceae bacterium SANA]
MSQWIWIGIAAFVVYRTAKGVYFTRKFKHLSPEEAKERLDREKIFLLDVRTPGEYKKSHLPKAHLIPFPELRKKRNELPDQEKTIFVYCKSGSRAMRACVHLVKMGYKDVNHIGGIDQWPYKVIKSKKHA